MEPITIIYSVAKIVKSQLDVQRTTQLLNETFRQISRVYHNIKKGLIQSAVIALIAASKKREGKRQDDIKFAIGNLQNAYYICKGALDEDITKGVLWWKDKECLIAGTDRKEFIESLLSISVIIFALYKYIGDEVNKNVWIEKSCSFYKSYLNTYFNIGKDELKRINPNFIEIRTVDDSDERDFDMHYDGNFAYPGKYDKKESFVTTLGHEYIKKEKESLIIEYRNELKTLTFVFNENMNK